MSAPEPQVRVYAGGWHCDCGWSGFIFHGQTQDDMEREAAEHEATCPLIRLQSRHDTLIATLHDLVGQWRERADDMELTGTGAQQWAAHCVGTLASELERAIGGGRG